MIKKHIIKKILSFVGVAVISISSLSAFSVFSGFAGGKIKFNGDKGPKEDFDPALSLQSFFAAQIGLSQNAWGHLEFSLSTGDLLESSIFHKTESLFKLDEFSITLRQPLDTINNYFSAFMGTYDPIGSDIFLQRQFSLNPITSKLTESWLGMAGSLLYPHFGIGISDVIQFTQPMATGLYLYVNHEDADYYVFNGDLRYACSFRFFTFDFAGGVGLPMGQENNGEAVINLTEFLYWHAGITMLLGNNYTNGLFFQGGIYNGIFDPKQDRPAVNVNDIYLLFEPRFRSKNMQFHFTVYSLPQETVNDLLFIHDTLGLDFNIFSDSFKTQNRSFSFGVHATLSFPQKTFYDFSTPLELFTDTFNVFLTPYFTTKLFGGELNSMIELSLMEFGRTWQKAFAINVGYKTAF